MQRHLALALALASNLVMGLPAIAEVRASANPDAKRQAQTLAEQALDNLRRGEDLTDKQQKLATYEKGLELASRAVALDEENADAHFAVFGNKGRILLLEGVGANPISLLQVNGDLERALELNPNDIDSRIEYAKLLEQFGDRTAAQEQYRLAIKTNEGFDPTEPKRLTKAQLDEINHHLKP